VRSGRGRLDIASGPALGATTRYGGVFVAQGYSLEQESMAKGAAAVEDASTLIDGQVKTLNSEVEQMFGGWSSQAQRSFATLHANWVEQQQKLLTALRDMHTALVSTGRTYATQEEQQSGDFSHIAGQI
jgi:WXG100 family type VII secretion target